MIRAVHRPKNAPARATGSWSSYSVSNNGPRCFMSVARPQRRVLPHDVRYHLRQHAVTAAIAEPRVEARHIDGGQVDVERVAATPGERSYVLRRRDDRL